MMGLVEYNKGDKMRITKVEFEIDKEDYSLSVSQTNLFQVYHNGTTIIMGVITNDIRYEVMEPVSDRVLEEVSVLLVLLIGSNRNRDKQALQRTTVLDALHTMS